MAAGDTLVNSSGSFSSTGGNNTLVGSNTGNSYTGTEDSNILIGSDVQGTGSDSNVLRIGKATGTNAKEISKTYICGINGTTVVGSAVLVTSGDQLGILISSERYKENIKDMHFESNKIMSLRPVTFNYKNDEKKETQYGLIAEEVAEVYPNLVIYDKDGKPLSIKYHDFPAILLNEMKKMARRIDFLEDQIYEKDR